MSVAGGEVHFIAKVEDTWCYRWSPDGKYIAYSDHRKGQEGLYVMGRDGAGVRKLVTAKAIGCAAWSPDGGRIRFDDHDSLWEVSSTGANLHPLFPKWKGPAGQCCGQWTPDGEFYIFLAGGNGRNFDITGGFEQIWALDERHRFLLPASPDPVPLTSGPTHWGGAIPSKDGNKIFANGTITRGELVRFDRTSKQLRPFLGGISAEFLTYSKDRTQIAYVTFPDGILWRAKADGTERFQLTNPPFIRSSAVGPPTDHKFCLPPNAVLILRGSTSSLRRAERRVCLFQATMDSTSPMASGLPTDAVSYITFNRRTRCAFSISIAGR
jgi:hypothetical protein